MQTFNGSDTVNLRYRKLSGSGVEIKLEEEQSVDTGTGYMNERIGYPVTEGSP
ncbi:hypothetical protein V5735_20380 (plasmid) [Haladaptatus sp. SPP-AMP-3]|uniref:hypothetical protein n=1 Tax=Haladaptatus sp. SPP-AMP-3 TaxID=3121295 RepID=UPI003C2E2724